MTSVFVALATVLSACGGGDQPAVSAAVRPVKTLILEDVMGIERSFPATIEASRRVDMSFRVPGMLTELAVKEGDKVEAGQMLARIDPTKYRLALDEAQAELERARSDWERARVLVAQGHLSRSDFDAFESTFRQAQAAREQARLNLSYTELKAPIEGTIARRSIQNFEEIAAKQLIFALRDNSELEVRLDIPEKLMMLLSLNQEAGENDEGLSVSFPAASDELFPLRAKEFATRADPQTQTFQARFTFTAPPNLKVLPGMSALVIADLSDLYLDDVSVILPAAAIDRRGDQALLWVYDPQSGTATPKGVDIGPVLGTRVEVLSGLALGDRVIVAGAESLEEGMALYEMRRVEQAE